MLHVEWLCFYIAHYKGTGKLTWDRGKKDSQSAKCTYLKGITHKKVNSCGIHVNKGYRFWQHPENTTYPPTKPNTKANLKKPTILQQF